MYKPPVSVSSWPISVYVIVRRIRKEVKEEDRLRAYCDGILLPTHILKAVSEGPVPQMKPRDDYVVYPFQPFRMS